MPGKESLRCIAALKDENRGSSGPAATGWEGPASFSACTQIPGYIALPQVSHANSVELNVKGP